MHLVQLLLPLFDNAGRNIPHAHFARVRDELTERFGGVTAYLRSPAEGAWRAAPGRVDRDEIVIFEVMVDHLDRAWWSAYRAELESRFAQVELVVRAWPCEQL
jgi:hypothetical protein